VQCLHKHHPQSLIKGISIDLKKKVISSRGNVAVSSAHQKFGAFDHQTSPKPCEPAPLLRREWTGHARKYLAGAPRGKSRIQSSNGGGSISCSNCRPCGPRQFLDEM
jgi:hypothetical protein